MAICHISEHVGITRAGSDVTSHTGDGIVPLVKEPALVEQPLAIGAEVKSSAFNAKTTAVRVAWDAPCHILFGASPTATTGSKFMPLAGVEYFEVTPGDKVSVIAAA
jgi:hypothetical protein